MATRPEPVVTLAAQAGIELAFEPRLAEWIPSGTSADVLVTGHMTGLVDDALIGAGAVLAGRLAAAGSVVRRLAGRPLPDLEAHQRLGRGRHGVAAGTRRGRGAGGAQGVRLPLRGRDRQGAGPGCPRRVRLAWRC